jgi:hypothetical protein
VGDDYAQQIQPFDGLIPVNLQPPIQPGQSLRLECLHWSQFSLSGIAFPAFTSSIALSKWARL